MILLRRNCQAVMNLLVKRLKDKRHELIGNDDFITNFHDETQEIGGIPADLLEGIVKIFVGE